MAVKARGTPVDGKTMVGNAETSGAGANPATVVPLAKPRRDVARGVDATASVSCQHPIGFHYVRPISLDGVSKHDLFHCPLCQARRVMDTNGRMIASCEAGGKWVVVE